MDKKHLALGAAAVAVVGAVGYAIYSVWFKKPEVKVEPKQDENVVNADSEEVVFNTRSESKDPEIISLRESVKRSAVRFNSKNAEEHLDAVNSYLDLIDKFIKETKKPLENMRLFYGSEKAALLDLAIPGIHKQYEQCMMSVETRPKLLRSQMYMILSTVLWASTRHQDSELCTFTVACSWDIALTGVDELPNGADDTFMGMYRLLRDSIDQVQDEDLATEENIMIN